MMPNEQAAEETAEMCSPRNVCLKPVALVGNLEEAELDLAQCV